MQTIEELKPPTYQELQNTSEYDFVTRSGDFEAYRTKDGLFIVFDLVCHDCITLEFDDVPHLLEISKQMYKVMESEVDAIPEEKLE